MLRATVSLLVVLLVLNAAIAAPETQPSVQPVRPEPQLKADAPPWVAEWFEEAIVIRRATIENARAELEKAQSFSERVRTGEISKTKGSKAGTPVNDRLLFDTRESKLAAMKEWKAKSETCQSRYDSLRENRSLEPPPVNGRMKMHGIISPGSVQVQRVNSPTEIIAHVELKWGDYFESRQMQIRKIHTEGLAVGQGFRPGKYLVIVGMTEDTTYIAEPCDVMQWVE